MSQTTSPAPDPDDEDRMAGQARGDARPSLAERIERFWAELDARIMEQRASRLDRWLFQLALISSRLRLDIWLAPIRWLIWLPIWLFYTLYGMFELVGDVLGLSLNPRWLVQGLPAMGTAGLVLLIALVAFVQPTSATQKLYREAGREAFVERDYQTAALCLARAVELGDRSRTTALELADALLADSPAHNASHAEHMMRKLAERREPRACAFIAERMMQKPVLERHEADEVVQFLVRALEDPAYQNDLTMHWHLGRLYFAREQFLRADRHLNKSSSAHPQAYLQLARIQRLDGNEAQAIAMLEKGEQAFRQQLTANAEDHDSRMALVQSLLERRLYDEGCAVLEQGHHAFPQEPRYARELAKLYLVMAELPDSSGRIDPLSRQALLGQAIHVLRQAIEANPDASDFQRMMVIALWQTGRQTDSEPYLKRIAEEQLDMRCRLALLYHAQGRTADLEKILEQLEGSMARSLAEDPQRHAARLLWIDTLLSVGALDRANERLLEGLSLAPSASTASNEYRQRQLRLRLQRCDALDQDSSVPPEPKLQLLAEVLEIDPGNMSAIARLVRYRQSDPPMGPLADEAIRRIIATSKAPAIVHFTLGSLALGRKDLAEARTHLEEAVHLRPEMGEAVNNLAWVLAQQDPPELDRALALLDPFMKRYSKYQQNAACKHTRGVIYYKMGRLTEAMDDLEQAIEASPTDRMILEDAIRVAEAIGRSDQARAYRDRLAGRVAAPVPSRLPGDAGATILGDRGTLPPSPPSSADPALPDDDVLLQLDVALADLDRLQEAPNASPEELEQIMNRIEALRERMSGKPMPAESQSKE